MFSASALLIGAGYWAWYFAEYNLDYSLVEKKRQSHQSLASLCRPPTNHLMVISDDFFKAWTPGGCFGIFWPNRIFKKYKHRKLIIQPTYWIFWSACW